MAGASCKFVGATQGCLGPVYDQGEPEDRREGERFAEQDHAVKEREDVREVVSQGSGPSWETTSLLPHHSNELVIEHEGESRAAEAEHDHRKDRTRTWCIARRCDGRERGNEHRPDAQGEEGSRARRHVLVPVLQLHDEPGERPAGRRAQDRRDSEELADWRPTSATPASPTAWTRLISALWSKRRAKTATNIGGEETSIPVRPDGTEVSPGETRIKGAAGRTSLCSDGRRKMGRRWRLSRMALHLGGNAKAAHY